MVRLKAGKQKHSQKQMQSLYRKALQNQLQMHHTYNSPQLFRHSTRNLIQQSMKQQHKHLSYQMVRLKAGKQKHSQKHMQSLHRKALQNQLQMLHT